MAPSHKQWIIPFAVQLIPAGLLLIGAFWLRESPRWLLSKGKREAALKNLCWIRQLPADEIYMVEEVAFLDAALEELAGEIGNGFWKPFKAVAQNRKVQWRFFLGGMLFLWQNGSGINVSVGTSTVHLYTMAHHFLTLLRPSITTHQPCLLRLGALFIVVPLLCDFGLTS